MFLGIHLLVKDRNSERQASLDTRRPMRRLQDRLHRRLTPASETDQSEKVILVQG